MTVTFSVRVPVELSREVEALRRLYVAEAMRATACNKLRAAAMLGLNRTTFAAYLARAELHTAQVAAAAAAAGELD